MERGWKWECCWECLQCYKVRETVNTQVLARNKLTGCKVVIVRVAKKIKEFVRVVWWLVLAVVGGGRVLQGGGSY